MNFRFRSARFLLPQQVWSCSRMFACHKIVHIRWPTETFAQARVDVKPMSISLYVHPFPQQSMDSCRIQRPLKVFCFRAGYHGALVRRFHREFAALSKGWDVPVLWRALRLWCLHSVLAITSGVFEFCVSNNYVFNFVCLNLVCLNLVWLKGELEAPPNEDLGCITSRAQRTVATCFTRFLENWSCLYVCAKMAIF